MWELEGLGRIERVARISPLDNDVANSFRRNRNEERKQESEFHKMLVHKVSQAERKEAATLNGPDQYLESMNSMHSLFYNMEKLNVHLPNSVLKAYE